MCGVGLIELGVYDDKPRKRSTVYAVIKGEQRQPVVQRVCSDKEIGHNSPRPRIALASPTRGVTLKSPPR